MVKLVLVRHGQSLANKENIYTGWNDVPLSELGIYQARKAGTLLGKIIEFNPIIIHTSILSRAIQTANLIAEECNWLWVPLQKTWRLNERHYGALRGINKEESKKIFGEEQVKLWRRGYTAVPPKLPQHDIDRRYDLLDPKSIPLAESLEMASKRILPYYLDAVASKLRHNEDQLVIAHGSSLRALVKYLEQISDEDIIDVEVPNAEPIVYEMDSQLKIIKKTIL